MTMNTFSILFLVHSFFLRSNKKYVHASVGTQSCTFVVIGCWCTGTAE